MKKRRLHCGICQRVTERNDLICLSCNTPVNDCQRRWEPKKADCVKCTSGKARHVADGVFSCFDCGYEFKG